MIEIELSLSKNEDRPVTRLYGRNTLIDTGALVPVFSFTEEFLKARFNAERLYENKSFSGFGNHPVYGDVYSLSNFYIKELHFKTLEAFVPYEKDINFPILIPAPLLCNTEYSFQPQRKRMLIRFPKEAALGNEFHILSLKKDDIKVQLNGVLMQSNSSLNILMQKRTIKQTESKYSKKKMRQDKSPAHIR